MRLSCHVDIVGKGEPVVLIHGWGMNGAVWQLLAEQLSKQRCVYIVDLPGMGLSKTIAPYHLSALAQAVSEVIPGVSDIVGWSLGGLVAQRLALDQPERVKRLVLVGTSPCFVTKPDWPNGILAKHFELFGQQFNQDFKATLLKFLTLQCMNAKDTKSTIRKLRAVFEAKPMPVQSALEQSLQILVDTDLREEVARIRQPTLIIHGDRDTLAPVSGAHWMVNQLPNAQLRVLAGAAHSPFLSHSAAFYESLVDYLNLPPYYVRNLGT